MPDIPCPAPEYYLFLHDLKNEVRSQEAKDLLDKHALTTASANHPEGIQRALRYVKEFERLHMNCVGQNGVDGEPEYVVLVHYLQKQGLYYDIDPTPATELVMHAVCADAAIEESCMVTFTEDGYSIDSGLSPEQAKDCFLQIDSIAAPMRITDKTKEQIKNYIIDGKLPKIGSSPFVYFAKDDYATFKKRNG